MRPVRFGFTLIEALLVIAVFSIGVLAVLKMVTYNISAVDTIRLKTTASFLAKESMTLAFNMRDTNRLAWLERDCVPNDKYLDTLDVCSDFLISWHQNQNVVWMLGVDPISSIDIRKVSWNSNFDTMFNQTRLGLFSWTNLFPVQYYGTWFGGSPTYFARYVLFTGVVESWVVLPLDQLVKIESHVLYKKGSITGEVVLESFIWNY